jgi:hypothetical protein
VNGGVYLLRTAAARRRRVGVRRAWVVRAASHIEKGAIVLLARRGWTLDPVPVIASAARLDDVQTITDRAGRQYLALVPAGTWPLERPFTLDEALGRETTYATRECPLVRLSALHEHAIRTGRWLGADLPPVDRMEFDAPVRELFFRLWDKAGTTQYDKSEWGRLRQLLCERGIEV